MVWADSRIWLHPAIFRDLGRLVESRGGFLPDRQIDRQNAQVVKMLTTDPN